MTRRIIESRQAPGAIGPYSQAVCTDGLLFTSGQIPVDPATGVLVEGGIVEQTRRVMDNLKLLLDEAGCGFGDVLKSTVYLTDMALFTEFNETYAACFDGCDPPARATVQVAGLPLGALVEIDLVVKLP